MLLTLKKIRCITFFFLKKRGCCARQEIRKNKLPSFACDGRKKFSRRIGDKKNKELLTKKNNDKKLGKKERMEHSNHGLQDQAAAP